MEKHGAHENHRAPVVINSYPRKRLITRDSIKAIPLK